MEFSSLLFALPTAFLLDLLIGDPKWLPHPIRWMGKWIETWEPYFRRLPTGLGVSGTLFALLLVSCTFLMTWGLLQAADALHRGLFITLQTVLIYYSISVRSLRSAAMDVYNLMKLGDLPGAKRHLSYIVGRDVQPLDAGGVMRGAAETVAENLVDGVLSPRLLRL